VTAVGPRPQGIHRWRTTGPACCRGSAISRHSVGQEISDLVLLVEPNAVGIRTGGPTETAASGADPGCSTSADARLARTDGSSSLPPGSKRGSCPARDEPVIRSRHRRAACRGGSGPGRIRGPAERPGRHRRERRLAERGPGRCRDSMSFIVAAAVIYRLREPVWKWWRRHDPAAARWRQPPRSFPRGPHFGSNRARTTRRARMPS
jgi:hypothetical protein